MLNSCPPSAFWNAVNLACFGIAFPSLLMLAYVLIRYWQGYRWERVPRSGWRTTLHRIERVGLREGMVRNGGWNGPPTTPRPANPPKGQGKK